MSASITLSSPLPAADLLFESMTASAGLSRLGDIELGLVSPRADLKAHELLGKPVTVTVALRDGAKRYFHGFVTRFAIGLRRGRYCGYQASVRPWLWFLTRTKDCRIFQGLSVPDIVKAVFDDHPHANFEFKLFRSYRQWVYCVQYRESDFNFIARLLELEGIYWYIEHADGASKLVLVDSQSAHDAAPGCASLPYYEDAAQAPPDVECVSSWDFASAVETDRVELTSYDFERPSTALKADAKLAPTHQTPVLEEFDYQGDYLQTADASQWAEDRLDAHQTRFQTAHAASNAHGVEVGRLLSLTRHPRDDQNAAYLVTATTVRARVDAYESGREGGGDDGGGAGAFECDFSAIPSAQQFRAPRQTPKPFVQGPQTALVVGPPGEEIFTDAYGRVKLQFHWDRRGKKDEKSSCWVRVASPWAGKNFGAIQTPRIGQEVVVDFLEGDPDQPLVTGRVYNAEQMPPWELPANATQSGLLTRSSKGGSVANANALRFEDKKGAEQLWLHAEKNQDIEVENDETHWVGKDRKKTIDHDETTLVKNHRTETVGVNETITVGVDRTEKVGANETIAVGANRSISVGACETAMVALQRTHLVGINETIAIGAAQEIGIGALQMVTVGAAQIISVGASQSTSVGINQSNTVGAAQTTTVGAAQSTKVGAAQSTEVGANRNLKVGGAQTTAVTKGRSCSIGEDDKLKVGKNFVIDAGESVTIKTGKASLTMNQDGTITLTGANLSFKASGTLKGVADGELAMKGSKIGMN